MAVLRRRSRTEPPPDEIARKMLALGFTRAPRGEHIKTSAPLPCFKVSRLAETRQGAVYMTFARDARGRDWFAPKRIYLHKDGFVQTIPKGVPLDPETAEQVAKYPSSIVYFNPRHCRRTKTD